MVWALRALTGGAVLEKSLSMLQSKVSVKESTSGFPQFTNYYQKDLLAQLSCAHAVGFANSYINQQSSFYQDSYAANSCMNWPEPAFDTPPRFHCSHGCARSVLTLTGSSTVTPWLPYNFTCLGGKLPSRFCLFIANSLFIDLRLLFYLKIKWHRIGCPSLSGHIFTLTSSVPLGASPYCRSCPTNRSNCALRIRTISQYLGHTLVLPEKKLPYNLS